MKPHRRQTVIVVRSARQTCVVCAPHGRAALVAGRMPNGDDARTQPTTPCPHCGAAHLPAVFLPFRADTPRGGAA